MAAPQACSHPQRTARCTGSDDPAHPVPCQALMLHAALQPGTGGTRTSILRAVCRWWRHPTSMAPPSAWPQGATWGQSCTPACHRPGATSILRATAPELTPPTATASLLSLESLVSCSLCVDPQHLRAVPSCCACLQSFAVPDLSAAYAEASPFGQLLRKNLSASSAAVVHAMMTCPSLRQLEWALPCWPVLQVPTTWTRPHQMAAFLPTWHHTWCAVLSCPPVLQNLAVALACASIVGLCCKFWQSMVAMLQPASAAAGGSLQRSTALVHALAAAQTAS